MFKEGMPESEKLRNSRRLHHSWEFSIQLRKQQTQVFLCGTFFFLGGEGSGGGGGEDQYL